MAQKRRTGAEQAFMKWALSQILAVPGHPLEFLVDLTRQDWHSRLGSRRKDAVNNEQFPAVQPGHLISFHALNDVANERLALQDADDNQEQNYTIEGRKLGMFVELPAINISGVPVVNGSAQRWER